jgi:hypothetical protein
VIRLLACREVRNNVPPMIPQMHSRSQCDRSLVAVTAEDADGGRWGEAVRGSQGLEDEGGDTSSCVLCALNKCWSALDLCVIRERRTMEGEEGLTSAMDRTSLYCFIRTCTTLIPCAVTKPVGGATTLT